MLKGIKRLFSYKKPSENEFGFELLEDSEESSSWNQYQGKESNLKEKDQQGNQYQQNDQMQKDGQKQEDVSGKLMQILQNSQNQQKSQNNSTNSNQKQSGADVSNKLMQILKDSQSKTNDQNQAASGDISSEEKEPSQSENDDQEQTERQDDKKGEDSKEQSGDKHKEKSHRIVTPLAIKDLLKDKGTDSSNSKEQRKNNGSENKNSEDANGNENKNDKDIQDSGDRKTGPESKAGSGNSPEDQNKAERNGKKGLESSLNEVVKNYETKMSPGSLQKNQKQNKDTNQENKGDIKQGNNQDSPQAKEKNKEGKKENQGQENKKDDSEGKNKQDNASSQGSNLEVVSTSLGENKKHLEAVFHIPTNKDVIIREFNVAREIPAFVVFVDGMIDKNVVIQFTLPQLMDVHPFSHFEGGCPLDYIEKNVLTINQIIRMNKFKEIITQVLSGLTAVFIDGCDECLVMESRGFEKRGIQAPVTETVVQGAQEGFTENLRTNITLVRRIIKNENLITEFNPISRTNNFLSALLYMEGLTNPKIVEEVKRRIKSIDIDYISGNGMMEQLIEDKPYMLFPQIISSERPDRVASFLMEGKVVLICEGTPFAIAMPITFFDLFHTSEESNLRWQYGTFISMVRIIGILLATFFPGMYTALILFHQEMIPTSLLASIVVSRAAVPFPTIVEILLMEFAFELIREGGIRVPGVIGNTLGIIGALILGQAAVQAGLVSPILIIVVAVSGLGSFAIPNNSLSLAVRIMRFLLIFFGYVGGFYGVSAAFTILCALALGMKSFGVPFFTPVAPTTRSNKDKVIRGPLYQHTRRPDFLNTLDEKRMPDNPRGWTSEAKGGGSGSAQGR